MTNEPSMTLQVSESLVRPVIEQKIHAAIVAELEKTDSGSLMAQIVGRVLTQKVDSEGKPTNYSSNQAYIEWLCQEAIRKTARAAVQEWVEKNREKFEKHFQAELSKRSSGMAKVFADGLLSSMKSAWQFKVDVGFSLKEER